MKISKLNYLTLLFFCCVLTSNAQTKVEEKQNNQPTIMVIPFTSEGINLRDAFENNSLVRVGITKVKEAFDQRGVNTIDLRAKIKQAENSLALQSDQKSSIKDEVINNSGADIYVEVECKPNYSSSGNSVTLIMTAYDTFSAESFANKVANSPKFYTTNFDKLVEKLAETEVPNLLNTIQQKFDDIRQNGRTITVRVGILEGSKLKMSKEIDKDGNLLSDAIEDFIQEKSFKNKYHVQGSTDAQINFDIVKVPLKDAEGNPFRISRFAADFRKFLKTKDLQCSQVINGNSIIFSIK